MTVAEDANPSPTPPTPTPPATVESRRWRWWLRLEVVLLALSLLVTLGAKGLLARESGDPGWLLMVLPTFFPDLAFFAGTIAVFVLLWNLLPHGAASRLVLLLTLAVGFWSVTNAGWILSTSVQIQPGVIAAAVLDPLETRLIITDSFARQPMRLALPAGLILVLGAFALFRFIRPARFDRPRRRNVVAFSLACVVLTMLAGVSWHGPHQASVWQDSASFSSHWHALTHLFTTTSGPDDASWDGRHVPRAAESTITPPPADAPRPNIVIVMLESTNHHSTSLGPGGTSTPAIDAIARDGVEFRQTRVPVPHTTKAVWTVLTGLDPEIRHGAAESVLVDEPYQSLASALGTIGYRSAFFQMTRGGWEGAPALFANLGLDYAWFRELLFDESTYLGWTSGDDMRAVGPMFDWADATDEPFMVGLVTTMSHDPYILPDWWPDPPHADAYERFLQTVAAGDAVVQEILDQLDARGLTDDTIVCVLGDHGEMHRPDAKRGRFATYDDAIRIPWVMRWPNGLDAGQVVDAPCSQLDITPTLLALLGFEFDADTFDGLDALGAIPSDRRLCAQAWYNDAPFSLMIGTDVKYTYIPVTESVFRYDLVADPGELRPVRVPDDEADRVIDELRAWQRSTWFSIPPQRSRSAMLYDGWRTNSLGRTTTSYLATDAPSDSSE